MTGAREQILASVRRARGDAAEPVAALAPRLRWAEADAERFTEQLRLAAATVETLAAGDIAAAVQRYVQAQSLQTPVRIDIADHPLLPRDGFPADWDVQRGGTPRPRARFGLSAALAGVAETGTLMLLSGAASPATLNVLPEHHLVVVPRIVPYFEDAWTLARQQPGFPPRAVNLVTGPSRTADIEQTLQLGAHGPRRLHVLIVAQG